MPSASDVATQKWPDRIWVVRHGQSAGNVARDAAEAADLPWIDIATRDVDTPLSALGEQQARRARRVVRAACRRREAQRRSLLAVRARAAERELILEARRRSATMTRFVADERLREKEFGILDRLTKLGIVREYPELDEQRAHVGKFYFRPPGGESWCDVILRLRSVIDTLTRDYRGERVLIVGHQVIVNCFRYLFERMTEARDSRARPRGRRAELRRHALRVRSIAAARTESSRCGSPISSRRWPRRGRRSLPSPTCRRRRNPDALAGGPRDCALRRRCLRRWPLPQPPADGDKEDRGRLLLVAGSLEVPGAAMLAGNAALRAGAGKVCIAHRSPRSS